jgi:hypothetical protein
LLIIRPCHRINSFSQRRAYAVACSDLLADVECCCIQVLRGLAAAAFTAARLTSTITAISQGEKGSSLGLMILGDRKHLHLQEVYAEYF